MSSPGKPSFRRACLVVLMLVSYTNNFVLAAPRGARVVSGSATFQQDGNLTVVTAANRSIINYSGFNIAPNEIVRFVQPNANSTVLNRVLNPNPTNIFGQIQANGIVYIVNPYGIYFRNGAVINVGGLYAAAGRISNADFTSGNIHFTDLEGDVRNDGVLAADNRIALMGANVVNDGTLSSAHGLAMMVSGADVYVGARNSNIFVQANGKTAATSAGASGSVTNRGTVAAPRVLLGAGDMYSTAIVNSGLLKGRSITVNAGSKGSATVGGRLDASSVSNATASNTGGSIQVLGGQVALQGAALDASGTNGGGSVRIGGDLHGGGTLPHSATTTVDAATTIDADATGLNGNGGSVVLWSDAATVFSGNVSARGGSTAGNGGSAEISSGGSLGFYGLADLTASAGKIGSLLLDPHNITISSATANPNPTVYEDINLLDGTAVRVPFNGITTVAVPPVTVEGPAADININAAALGTQLGKAAVTLQANNDIEFSASVTGAAVTAGNGSLTLQAGRSIILDSGVTLSLQGALNATFNDAGATAANRDAGRAAFTMGVAVPAVGVIPAVAASQINAPGGVTITAGAFSNGLAPAAPAYLSTLAANTGAVTLQGINTTALAAGTPSGAITVNNNAVVNTATSNLDVTAASITVGGSLVTDGHAPDSGAMPPVPNTTAGNIALTANGALSVNGLSAAGQGTAGTGGAITLAGNAAAGTNAVTLGGAVTGGSLGVTARVTNTGGVVQTALGQTLLSNGTVTTSGTGGQSYDAAVALGAAGKLTANGGGPITFDSTVNSVTIPQALTATTTGTTTFKGAVGGSTVTATAAPALASVTISGPAEIDATSVTTTGAQSYGLLTLGGTGLTTLSSTGATGSISPGIITGAGNPLTVNLGDDSSSSFAAINNAGALNFNGGFDLTFTGAITATSVKFTTPLLLDLGFTGGSVTTSAGQTYGNNVTVVLNAPLTLSDTGKGNISLDLVTSAGSSQPLTINTGGTTTFGNTVGAVGGTTLDLSGLTVGASGASNLGGTAQLDGGKITTNGTAGQVFNDKVTLGATTTINANSAPVTFARTLASVGAVAQALTVNTTGATTFGGAVDGTVPLASLTTNVGGTTAINGGSVHTTGAQTYNDAVTLGADTVFTASGVTFNSTFTGNNGVRDHDLTLDLSGTATVSSSLAGVRNFTSDGSGTTQVGGTFHTSGSQTYGNALTLTADTTLTSGGGGNLTFSSTVKGAYELSLTPAGTAVFGGVVGGTVGSADNLTSLLVTGNASTTAGGTAITTSGNQEYTGSLTLGSTGTLTSTGGEVTVGSLDGSANGYGLTVDAVSSSFGTITRGGDLDFAVGAGTGAVFTGTVTAASLTVTGGQTVFDDTTDSSASVTTNSATGQSYGAVSLDVNTTLTDNALGSIKFGGTVDGTAPGAQTLTVLTNGQTTFKGFVGSVNALGSLMVGGPSYVGGTTTFNSGGNAVTTLANGTANGTGTQTYSNAVQLGNDTTLTSSFTNPGTAGGNIVFNGTVNGASKDGQSLTVDTSGATTFHGLVGATTPLLGLTSGEAGGGGTTFSMDATGQKAGVGGVNVGAGGLTVYDQAFLDVTGSSSIKVPAKISGVASTSDNPSVAATGGPIQFYNAPVVLEQDTVLVGASLVVPKGINGTPAGGGTAHGLTLDLGTAVNVSSANLTGLSNFASVGTGGTNLTGDLTTPGYQYYGTNAMAASGGIPAIPASATTLTGNVILTSSGGKNIGFGGLLDGLHQLTVRTSGETYFDGLVGSGLGTALSGLRVDNGSTAKTGTTHFDMNLTGQPAGTAGVNVSGSGVFINGPVQFAVTGSVSDTLPSIRTTGGQSYYGAATLGQDTVLTNTDTNNIEFHLTVDGVRNLTLNSLGNEIFDGQVGSTDHLLSLTTDADKQYAGGDTIFAVAGSSATAPTVTTANGVSPAGTATQTYNDAVQLNAPTFLTNTAASTAGAFVFSQAVNAAGGGIGLTLSTGDAVTFNSTVGTGGAPDTLSITAGRGTFFNNATGLLASGSNEDVNVGPGGLTITGPTTFNVAGISQTDLSRPTVVSAGTQTYDGTVTLSQTASLYAQGSSDITFKGDVVGDGTGLLVNTAGDEIFKGNVGGGANALGSLAIDTLTVPGGTTTFSMNAGAAAAGVRVGAGGLTINDAVFFSATNATQAHPTVLALLGGSQTYNGAATLTTDTVLVGTAAGQPTTAGAYSGGGAIDFGSTVAGGMGTTPNLTIGTGSGPTLFQGTVNVNELEVTGANVTFAKAVGGLNILSIAPNGMVAGGTITLGAGSAGVTTITTSLGQTYGSAVVLAGDTILTDTGSKDIDFGSTLDGGFNLTINTAGTTTFGGFVGGSEPLASLTTDAPGTTDINGGGVTTSNLALTVDGGEQTYNDKVVLSADAVLDAITTVPTNRGITFGNTVDSLLTTAPRALSATGYDVEFDNTVGAGAPLLSLTTGGSNQTFLGGTVGTTTFQTYGSVAGTTIEKLTVLTAGTDISFLTAVQGVDAVGSNSSLTLNAPGVITFGQAVGTTPLTSLTVNGGTLLLNGGLVNTALGQTYKGQVELGATTLLESTGVSGASGNIVFNATLDGAFGLTVNTGALTQFNAKVGGTTALASLTTDNEEQPGEQTQFLIDAATKSINPASVNVTGAVAINDAVEFGGSNNSAVHPMVQTASGSQDYYGAGTLAADTLLTSTGGGNLTFHQTLDGRFNLTLDTVGLTVFSGFVGGGAPLASMITDVGGTTEINGGGVITVSTGTTSGAQTYNDAVSLGANTVLTSQTGSGAKTGGELLFNSTLDGAFSLKLNTSGQTVFNGVVGSVAPLASLTTDGTGTAGETTHFNMTVGTAAAGVIVDGPITINDPVVFAVVGSSLAQPGVLTLGNGAQTYTGEVSLATNTVLVSALTLPTAGSPFTGGGAINFSSTLGIVGTGGNNLFVRAGVGTATFGSTINVSGLDLGGAMATFDGPIVLPGLLSVEPNGGGTSGTVVLTGGGLTTTGAQVYNASVILGANTVLVSSDPAVAGGSIVFNGTVDGTYSLTLNTPGDEVFNGLVGSLAPLASLTTDAVGPVGGTAEFNMDAAGATAGVNVAGAVTINDGVRFDVAGSQLAAGGPASVLSGGTQTYQGAATLAQDTSLVSSGAGDLTFAGRVDGGHGLALSSAGNEVFGGLVGNINKLASLTTDAVGPVGGTAEFNMDAAGATAGVNVAGAVTINDGVRFDVAGSQLAAGGPASVLSGGTQTYQGAATLAQDTALVSSGAGDLTFAGRVDGGHGLALSSAGNEVFGGLVGNINKLASLTTDAVGPVGGTAEFNMDAAGATAGVNVAGAVTINDGVRFDVAGSSLTNTGPASVLSGGAQTYQGAATLAQDTVLTSSGAGDLTFAGRVDGGHGLALSSAGNEVFGGLVGNINKLASLTTDAVGPVGGTAEFNMDAAGATAGVNVAGAVTINDATVFNVAGSQLTAGGPASVLSGGAQTYQGSATLTADTALVSSGAGDLTFAGRVDGGHGLALSSAGNEVFGGLVGNINKLASLTTDAVGPVGGTAEFNMDAAGATAGVNVAGAVTINDGVRFDVAGSSLTNTGPASVLSGGAQTYQGAATLAQDTALVSSGAGDLTFAGRVDGGHGLALSSAGNEVFGGLVGNINKLASLTTDAVGPVGGTAEFNMDAAGATAGVNVAGAVTINDGVRFDVAGSQLAAGGPASVLSGGTQTYQGAATLAQDTALVSSGAGDLTFAGRVDGGHGLALSSAGNEVFGGLVGNINKLASLTTDAVGPVGGTAEFNMDAAGATAGVNVAGAVTINDGVRFDVAGSSLTNTGPASVLSGGAQTYQGAATLAQDTVLTSSGAGDLTFKSRVNDSQGSESSLALNTGGVTTFEAAVGNQTPLASIETDQLGTTVFTGSGHVTTSGTQTYGDDVVLKANGSFTSINNRTITFDGTLDGAKMLLISTNGDTIFGGLVGSQTPLISVTTVSGPVLMNGQGVATTGVQNYGGSVVLGAPTTLTSGVVDSGTNAITFNSTVDGGNTLTLNSAGNTMFMAGVGSITPLASLKTTGPSVFAANAGGVSTSASQSYGGAVVLGADNTVFTSASGAVAFQQAVDGAADGANTLVISSPGQSALNGNVGASMRLAKLTVSAPLSIGGDTVTTTGDQEYNGTVNTASSATQISADTGHVRFYQNVSASGSLTVTANRIASVGDITTAGDLDLESTNTLSPILLLSGQSYVSTGGSVFFNTRPYSLQAGLSDAATILLSNPGTVTIRGANFTMGYLQKMFSLGSVQIEVGGGVATVGDIAARDNLRIGASTIVLLDRPAGLSTEPGVPNNGLNFVADDSINFGQARLVFGGPDVADHTANFITATGNITIHRVEGVSLYKDVNLDNEFRNAAAFDIDDLDAINDTANPFSIVDQPVGGGVQSLDTAAAISGALPDQKPVDVAADITISASQMEELKKLGIHPRLAQRTERGSVASKRALFAQLVDGQDMENYGRLQPIKGGVSRLEPSDYVVVVDRMGEREVQSILQSFESLYGKNKEKAPVIGAAFQDAFNDYTVAKQTADPAGFSAYLQSQPGKYPAVDTATRGFDDLFGHIEHLGLTDKEVAKSEEHITSDLGVSGVSSEDMVKVINAQRKKLPPEQKAASTKALPSAAASNPAPGTSAPAVVNKAVPVPGVAVPATTTGTAAPSPAPDTAIPEVPALPEPPTLSVPPPTTVPPPAPMVPPSAPAATPTLEKPPSPPMKITRRHMDRTRQPAPQEKPLRLERESKVASM